MNLNFKRATERGFSLVEVVLALGMAGVVGLGAAFVVQQQVMQQKRVQTKMDLNSAHAIALQKARNLEFISDQLGISTSISSGVLTPQQLCLAGNPRASGCSQLTAAVRPKTYSMIKTTGAGNAISNITSHLVCSGNSCSKIEVTVDTELQSASNPTGGGSSNQQGGVASPTNQITKSMQSHLTTQLELPALAFAPVEEIKMACASTSSMYAGVSLSSRAGLCGQLLREATSCSQAQDTAMFTFGTVVKTLPLSSACSNLRSRTCNGAFTEAGIGTIGQGADPILCRGLASIAPTPAPPPPRPPTPTPTPPVLPPIATPTATPVGPAPTPPTLPPVATPTPAPPVPSTPVPAPSSCSCGNITVAGRTWSPCGPPGQVRGNECLIDSWQSNNRPIIGCTRAIDLGLPESCTYVAPAPRMCNGTPEPPMPPRTCAPGEVRMMCGGDRWLCRSTGWEWQELNICGIPGVTRCP